MNRKTNKIPEIIWLTTTLLCLIITFYETVMQGMKQSYVFFIFALLSFLMFMFRRNLRKKT